MPIDSEAALQPSFEPSLSWLGIWLTAVTRPSVATYERLLRQPNVTARQAVTWILVSGLFSGVIGSIAPLFSELSHREPLDTWLLLATPAIAVLAALYWIIFTGSTQWIARLLKGDGTYQGLAYAFATFSAPLTIAVSLFALLPRSGLPLLILYLYWLALYVPATRAVNHFSRARAIGSVFLSLILVAGVSLGVAFLVVVLNRSR